MAKTNDRQFYGLTDKQLDFLDRKMEAILPTEDKEGRKSFAGLFDGMTLKTIFKLFNTEHLRDFEFPIATGKEADVFCCSNKEGELLAIKIFRTNTTGFRKMLPYLEGDRRFTHLKKGMKNISKIWTQKEFKNLNRLFSAGVSVPEPVFFKDNIIIMEYIGDETSPSPDLRNSELTGKDYQQLFDTLKHFLYKAYRVAEIVHADLSEYNILIRDKKAYIIDVGQAVLRSHPHAEEYLRRDIKNMVRFFSKNGVEADEDEVWDYLHDD